MEFDMPAIRAFGNVRAKLPGLAVQDGPGSLSLYLGLETSLFCVKRKSRGRFPAGSEYQYCRTIRHARSESCAYLEERFLEARTRILPRECSMSGHFKCRASPMRRPEENIRQSSALNFKSVMEERKTRISSLVGTKGR